MQMILDCAGLLLRRMKPQHRLTRMAIRHKHDFTAARSLLCELKGGRIRVDKDETTGIATVCLDHPEKKNAITGEMLLQLEEAAQDLFHWQCGKAFILHGSGGMFSSGGDLSMSKATAVVEQGFMISRFSQEVTKKLRTLPLLSVACIEGMALGGGAELCVAACDWRIFAPNASIAFVHGRMGITPGWGGTVALKRLLGSSKALDILTTARHINAPDALNIGLSNATLDSNSPNVLDAAKKWILQRTGAPVEVIRAMKTLLTDRYDTQDDKQDDEFYIESTIHAKLWGGEAKMQALAEKIKHKNTDIKK